MALQVTKTNDNGLTLSYWRVDEIKLDYTDTWPHQPSGQLFAVNVKGYHTNTVVFRRDENKFLFVFVILLSFSKNYNTSNKQVTFSKKTEPLSLSNSIESKICSFISLLDTVFVI